MSFAHHLGFLEYFHAGSITHAAVLVALLCTTATVATAGQHFKRISPLLEQSLRRRFACAMLLLWLVGFLRDLQPDRIGWENSIPLHLCDILGLVAPLALLLNRRTLQTILYFGGLGLSSQAFLAPVLRVGPLHLDFWMYWITHGAIVIAAVYGLAVQQYRPAWRDWQLAVVLSAAYLLVVIPVDVLLHVNYGYVGDTIHAQRSLVVAFGPWPARVPRLILTAWTLMAGMMFPWMRWKLQLPSARARHLMPA